MKPLYLIYALVAAAVVSGCNGRIFIDEPESAEHIQVCIDGDGGEATVEIPMSELERIVLDTMSGQTRFVSYYNEAGEIISSHSPASEVSAIVYDSDFQQLVIKRRGNKLDIHSVCNTADQTITRTIRLIYSYGYRYVNVDIGSGEPLELVDVACPEEITDVSTSRKMVSRITVHNDAPLPTTTEEMPFLNEMPSLSIESSPANKWIDGEEVAIPVPLYAGGEWRLSDAGKLRPGHTYHIGGPDRFTKVEISIPAQSHVTVTTDVIYSTATTSGSLLFLNRILDRPIIAEYTVTSTYPISYETRIDEVP